jgi:hypothetical protein
MNAIDLSADVGLVAVALVTLNLAIGLLIAVRYSPWRYWPHRRFNIFQVHNWTGYSVLGASVLASRSAAILAERAIPSARRDLSGALAQPAAREHDRSDRAVLHHGGPDHFLFPSATWPATVEIAPLRDLRSSHRAFLAQPVHRPEPEKHAPRPAGWREGVRRDLLRAHRGIRSFALAVRCAQGPSTRKITAESRDGRKTPAAAAEGIDLSEPL